MLFFTSSLSAACPIGFPWQPYTSPHPSRAVGEAHLDGGGKTKEIGLYNMERDTSAPFNCAGEHILTLSMNCKDEKCALLLELASYFLLFVKGNCVAPSAIVHFLKDIYTSFSAVQEN